MARASNKAESSDRRRPADPACFSTCSPPSAARGRNACRLSRTTWKTSPLSRTAHRIAEANLSDDIRSYLGDLSRRGLQASSVARKLSAIRPALSFPVFRTASRRRSGRDPGRPRRGRPLPKVLSIADVDRLIVAARDECAERGRQRKRARRTAVLPARTLYATGLRVSELVALPASARGAISAC